MNITNILWLSFILPIFTYILHEIKDQLFRKIYKTIIISSLTTEFKWIKAFLNKNALVVDKLTISLNNSITDKFLKNEESNYALPYGKFYITFNNIIYNVIYKETEIQISTYSFNTSWDQLTNFIKHAKKDYKDNYMNSIGVYKLNTSYDYNFVLIKNIWPRDLDTIILPKETKSLIFNNLDSFFEQKKFYKRIGISYKRGILFEGLPGTGKTTIIKCLCRRYELKNIYILDLDNKDTLDKVEKIQDNSLIVIEDIDRYFRPVKEHDKIVSSEPTFNLSKMLNLLDGILSPEKCLIIITTNNKNIIPQAMLRPGRIDLEVSFTYCNRDQIINYTKLFFNSNEDDIITKITNKLVDKKITISQLQKYYLGYINDLNGAWKNIDKFNKN